MVHLKDSCGDDLFRTLGSSVVVNQIRHGRSGTSGLQITPHVEAIPGAEAFAYTFTLRNTGEVPLVLNEIQPIRLASAGGGLLDLGPEPGEQTSFDFHDTLHDNAVTRFRDRDGRHTSSPFCHLHNPRTGRTFFAGALTFDRMVTQFELTYDPASGAATLTCRQTCNDFALPPGAELRTETLFVGTSRDGPFGIIEDWAARVQARYQPQLPARPPAGYIGSAWGVSEEQGGVETFVAESLKALRERLGSFGIQYFWISIANLKDQLPGNWLSPNLWNFPAGVETTLARIREAGLLPGLWVAPFYITEGSEPFAENRENLFKNSAAHYPWTFTDVTVDGHLPRIHHLDPSHPRTLAFLRDIFTRYRAMGVRYFMVDFLQAGRPREENIPHDPSQVKGWEAYRRALELIREVVGPDTHLLSAIGATLGHVGIMNASRIGSDYGEGRAVLKQFPSFPANYVINGNLGEVGCPNKNAIRNLACWFFAHNRFFLCDSNLLTVDKPIPRSEAELSASLFGISGGPVMLGDDIRRLDGERLALVKKCLPRAISTPIPVDLFTNLDNDCHRRTFVVPVVKAFGSWSIVALFNLEADDARFTLEARELRLDPGTPFRMFDFWDASYCGLFQGRRTVAVPANSAKIFRLEAVRPHPWILSTDMHVRQGEVELLDVRWDEASQTLGGRAMRPAGERGSLYIIAPPEYKERHGNDNLWVAKSAVDESLIIRKELVFGDGPADWRIEFARLDEEERAWQERHRARFRKAPPPAERR